MRFPRPDLTLALALSSLSVAGPVRADVPAGVFRLDGGELRPTQATLSEDVFDPIFAFVLSVLERDLYGGVDTAWFDSLATVEGGSKMPYQEIARLERRPGDDFVDAYVRMTMGDRTDFPIPYSILGYNPGTMRFAPHVDMLHWNIGDRDFEFVLDEDEGETVSVAARDAHLFVISDGYMELDIDGWLDRLLGGRLDDVSMTGFFVFREGDDYIGLGFGYNKSEDGRTGSFDFVRNESIFPAPKVHLSVGRTMRSVAEARLERWRRARATAEGETSAPAFGDARLR